MRPPIQRFAAIYLWRPRTTRTRGIPLAYQEKIRCEKASDDLLRPHYKLENGWDEQTARFFDRQTGSDEEILEYYDEARQLWKNLHYRQEADEKDIWYQPEKRVLFAIKPLNPRLDEKIELSDGQEKIPWKLPDVEICDGESIREAAERCIDSYFPNGSVKLMSEELTPTIGTRLPIQERRKLNQIDQEITFVTARLDFTKPFEFNLEELYDWAWMRPREVHRDILGGRYKTGIKRSRLLTVNINVRE